MKVLEEIRNPSGFLLRKYQPGLSIWSDTASSKTQNNTEPNSRYPCPTKEKLAHMDDDEAFHFAAKLLAKRTICSSEAAFEQGLCEFADTNNRKKALAIALSIIDGKEREPSEVRNNIYDLLEHIQVLKKTVHHPVRIYCHIPGDITELEDRATHFGYVINGKCNLALVDGVRPHHLYAGTYFCLNSNARILGDGEIQIISCFGYRGLQSIAGPIENWGRLKYIDGCTDTLLVPPTKKGEPCYNALFFPPGTKQSQHTHPSIRAGIVVDGQGICRTPSGDYPLLPKTTFLLPAETLHSFHTEKCEASSPSALTVLAFHPDSDFGPSDEDHPMLNRTYREFANRLHSAKRLRE